MKDEVVPEGKWEFDESVSSCFEDMLERSIPQYTVMREAVFNLGTKILEHQKQKHVLDLGCSDGLNLERFVGRFGATARFSGVDSSVPMITKARTHYKSFIDLSLMTLDVMDLRTTFPKFHYALIMSILTLQFIPIEYRQSIIQNVYDHLDTGGGFIMVEKVLGNCSELNEIMVDEYLKLKSDNGYTREQIERKRLSLEGVLVPVTSNWNQDLLKQAGFRKIDVFWRWMNFEGYIAIK